MSNVRSLGLLVLVNYRCHIEDFVVTAVVDVHLLGGQQRRRLLTTPTQRCRITAVIAFFFVVDVRTPAGLCRRSCHNDGGLTDEQLTERLSELLAHAAVDEEVDRVAEEDDEVDEESGGATNAWVHQFQGVR